MAKFVSQPPAGSRIDWGNPLTRGLVDLWIFTEGAGVPRSLTSTNPLSSSAGGTWGAAGAGRGRRYTGAANSFDRWDGVAARNLTGAVTVAVGLTSATANPSNTQIIGKRTGNSPASDQEWGFFTDATAGIFFTWQNSSTYQSVFNGGSLGAIPAGQYMSAVATRPTAATSGKLYKNGTLIQSTTGLSVPTSGGVAVTFAAANNGTELLFDGVIHWAGLWNRELSEVEVQTLNANPYALLTPVSPLRFFGGLPPTPITTVVKAKGKGIPPLRIPSSGSATFAALSQAVFAVSADFDGTAILYNGAGVSQGSMTQDARANNSGKVQSLIFSKYIPSAGSYYAIFTMSSAGNAAGALLEIANVAAASQIDQTAAATGSSTSPSSGATSATTQAYEVVIGAIGTEGPGGDTQGSWSNGFQPIAYTGTTGGAAAANVSLSVGYKIVSATGAQTAAKTGITSRQWGAAVATYKGLVASAPAADPVTYLTTSPLNAGTVGDFYSEYFEVYGGVAPYTYAVQSGSLPGGLSLATDGGLSGTPTLAGVYTFTIRATDSAAETEDLACSLTISAAAAGRRKPKTHILTMPGRFF